MRLPNVVLSFLMVLALATCGCRGSGSEQAPDVEAIASRADSFVGTSVSMRGLPVFYTAVYATADGEVTSKADKANWLCIVVVNQKKVTQGLLVCVRSDDKLDDVHTRNGEVVRIEGPVKTFVKKELVEYLKQKQGVDILTTSSGQPLWIEDQLPLSAPSASPSR